LIYRTEPTIEKWKDGKLKSKKTRICSEVSVNIIIIIIIIIITIIIDIFKVA